MKDTGTLKKTPLTEPMMLGCNIPYLPKPEKGIRYPCIEEKPIWRILCDKRYKIT